MTTQPSKRVRQSLAPIGLHYHRRPGRGKPRTPKSYYEMAFIYLQYRLCQESHGEQGMNMPHLADWKHCTVANIYNLFTDFCKTYPDDCNNIDTYVYQLLRQQRRPAAQKGGGTASKGFTAKTAA